MMWLKVGPNFVFYALSMQREPLKLFLLSLIISSSDLKDAAFSS